MFLIQNYDNAQYTSHGCRVIFWTRMDISFSYVGVAFYLFLRRNKWFFFLYVIFLLIFFFFSSRFNVMHFHVSLCISKSALCFLFNFMCIIKFFSTLAYFAIKISCRKLSCYTGCLVLFAQTYLKKKKKGKSNY